MALTVYNAMKLNTLRNFRLIAGQLGLDRRITKTGILDYEFAGDMPLEIENQFDVGELVLSSMLYAKENESALFEAVQRLVSLKAAALAIKTIYFKELPDRVRELADREEFPIFLFDNSVFFEDIITEIATSIRQADRFEQMEYKLETLLHKDLSSAEIRALSLELNRHFKKNLVVYHCKSMTGTPGHDPERIFNAFQKNSHWEMQNLVLKYKDGVIIFISEDSGDPRLFSAKFQDILAYGGLDTSEFWIGESTCRSTEEGLALALQEAQWALRVGFMEDQAFTRFAETGVYRVLLPHENSGWLEMYWRDTMAPLLQWDLESHGELLNTAVAWIQCRGDIKESARMLFIHENTVRYRIRKIHGLLGADLNEYSFYERLAVGVRIHRIKGTLG